MKRCESLIPVIHDCRRRVFDANLGKSCDCIYVGVVDVRTCRMLLAAGLVLALPPAAGAVEVAKFFGHSITVDGEYPELALKIDGRKVHTDAILRFDELVTIDGIPTLIGNSSNGGNACDGTPFMISFPANANPRFDGPIEACAYVQYQITAKNIVFSTNNIPGEGAERWVWTPAGGIRKLADEPFSLKAGTGWNALRERTFDHPADVFNNAEISKDIEHLLGDRFSEFEKIMVGTGSGQFKGSDFVASACTAHMCGMQEGIVFLSAEDRQVFAAWKPYNQNIVVFPSVKQWPEKARLELKKWAGKWN
jgi:hypothetical protein